MAEEPLHVVFGTGQVGLTLAARLAASGTAVRAVSRHRPAALADGVDWRAADATDPEATADAAKGASVVYQCLNAPYTKWPELFPPLQCNVLRAAERADALLVAMENLYGYGPTGGKPMTEDLPLAATTKKGRARAAMTAELLAASEAGQRPRRRRAGLGLLWCGSHRVHPGSKGLRQCRGRQAGRLHRQPRPPPHLQLRARHRRRPGHPRHRRASRRPGLAPAGPETVTTRAFLDLVDGEVGHPVEVRNVGKVALRALGLVNPLMRELAEMSYEFEEPFVLDTSKYQSTFGAAGTPLARAVPRQSPGTGRRGANRERFSGADGRRTSPGRVV